MSNLLQLHTEGLMMLEHFVPVDPKNVYEPAEDFIGEVWDFYYNEFAKNEIIWMPEDFEDPELELKFDSSFTDKETISQVPLGFEQCGTIMTALHKIHNPNLASESLLLLFSFPNTHTSRQQRR
jgi:hypothetical protein